MNESKTPQQKLFEYIAKEGISDEALEDLVKQCFNVKFATVDEACDVSIEDPQSGERWLTVKEFGKFFSWLEANPGSVAIAKHFGPKKDDEGK